MTEIFNTALASRRLREVSTQLEEIGAKIIQKRNETVLAEAAYLGAKADARKIHLADKSATAAQMWVEQDTVGEKVMLIKAEAGLRNLQDQKDIIIEVNNNNKVAIKIWETEILNLKYAS